MIDLAIPARVGVQKTFVMKTYYVYILATKRNGTLYTGVTSNLLRRVNDHKSAEIPGFTQRYHVHKLVYFETCGRIEDAIRREKLLKRWKRQWKLRLIEQANPQWRDLFDDLVR
jgi:putative endonuclease